MTHNVATVRSDERLSHAVATLIELPVRHLPVVDDGRLVGMLSDRDMRELGAYEMTLEKARQLSSMKVSDVMTRTVVTADPATAVPDLIQSMLDAGIGAVPVVEAGTQRLVGIVSYADLLRAAAPRFE